MGKKMWQKKLEIGLEKVVRLLASVLATVSVGI